MQGTPHRLHGPTQTVAGPGSQALKYDILTALLAMAAQGEPLQARLALRLSLLITARFNWRTGTFAVGQREMARMWGVTERTAKREMAQMRSIGWISVSVPAARGRVAQHSISLPTVLRATMPHWEAVGPDFAARMTGSPEPEPTNVVPLRSETSVLPPDDGTGWAAAARRLQEQDPAVYRAWLAQLQAIDLESGLLTLAAPSRFTAGYIKTHYQTRILAAVTAENRAIRDIQIIVLQG